MARHFVTSGFEFVQFPVNGNAINGGSTLVAILQVGTARANAGIVAVGTTGGAIHGPSLITTGGASSKLQLTTDGNVKNSNSTFTILPADGWMLVAASKASGSATPRMHKYVYATNTWTHQNGSAAIADGSGPLGTDSWFVGVWDGIEAFEGDIAAVALFNSVLTDAQIESLPFTAQALLSMAPVSCWIFDQDTVTQKVDDHAGNANQSGISGTSVSTSSIPVFNITDGVWVPTIVAPAAGGGTNKSIAPASITGTSTMSSTVQAKKNLTPATIAATSTMSSTVIAQKHLIPASITATSTMSSSIRKLAAVTPASITGTSTMSSTITKLGTDSILPAAITATSTMSAALQFKRALGAALISGISTLGGTVTGGSGAAHRHLAPSLVLTIAPAIAPVVGGRQAT